MYFVGLDLAWGEKSQTGVAVIDTDGRLLHVGAAGDDESITAAIAPFVRGECVVAIDAPLVVPNETGARPCEVALSRDFWSFDASARPAYRGRPEFNPPRAETLAIRWGLDMDPSSGAPRRAIEVFPHPATIVLFGLDKTLKYKRGNFEQRKTALLELMTLIEGLDDATPRLRVNRNVAWVELRKRVEAATKAAQLDSNEDPVDAVLCAYVALFRQHRPEDVTVYGSFDTGYIVTPTLPPDRASASKRRVSQKPSTSDALARLTQVAALLEQAQLEIADIRRQLES